MTKKQNPTELDKFTARTWIITSTQGKRQAVIAFSSAVSLAWLARKFPAWKLEPVFDTELETATNRAKRYMLSKHAQGEGQ